MKIFEIIKSFLRKIMNKEQNLIESPKLDVENISSEISKKRNEFEELLKVNLTSNNTTTSKKGGSNIETLQCINDGLGFQKIKNY